MATKTVQKTTAKTSKQTSDGFSTEERAAMKARAQELKAEVRASKDRAAGENAVLAALAEMAEPDRTLAAQVHDLVKASAPDLSPKTWYGMPAYAKDGKVVCYFHSAQKFGGRYATFGFNDGAKLDNGPMWPTSYALSEVTPEVEEKIRALVKQAVS